MADNQFDILIRFVTELVGGEAAKSTVKDMGDLDQQIQEVEKNLKAQNKELDLWKTKLKELRGELAGVRKGGAAYKQIKSEMAEVNETITYGTQLIKDNKEAHRDLVKQLRDEEVAQGRILANMRLQRAELSRRATLASRAASRVGAVGTGMVVAGTAIGGGIIAEATRYAAKMKDATAGTQAFNAELKKIEAARGRIDEVLVAQVLPILRVASQVAEKVAGIIEKNPQLVSLALKGAALLVSIGTLAKIAAGGIRMYADATFAAAQAIGLRAAEMQLLASNNQLEAAIVKGTGGKAAAAAATVGKVGVAALGFTALNLGWVKLIDMMEEAVVMLTKSEQAGKRFGDTLADIVSHMPGAPLVAPFRTLLQILEDFGKTGAGQRVTNKIKDWLGGSASGAAPSAAPFGENTAAMVEAFTTMTTDLANEESRFQSQRLSITQAGNNAILRAEQSNASRISAINSGANNQRGKLLSDFASGAAADLKKYEQSRAEIIRDGGLEINRIEEDRLDQLRKLEQDHNDNMSDLVSARDALGIVKEQRRFDREKSELDQNTNKEIAQRRQDLAVRLQDLAANFAAERAQKQIQLQQALKDNETARQAALKEEQVRHAEEMKQIRAETIGKLKELDANHKAEILRIRAAFIARRQDLGVFLNNEQLMIRKTQAAMLADLQRYLAAERQLKAGGVGTVVGSVGSRAAGGYTHGELVQTHGVEFVTSPSTTRALERLIGGRLSQQGIVNAVAGAQVTVNDSRRFSGEYTKSMRREIQRDTLNTLGGILK